jgi:hypothetical protein
MPTIAERETRTIRSYSPREALAEPSSDLPVDHPDGPVDEAREAGMTLQGIMTGVVSGLLLWLILIALFRFFG